MSGACTPPAGVPMGQAASQSCPPGAQPQSNPHLQFRCRGCCAPSPLPGCLRTGAGMKPGKMPLNRCHLTLPEAGERRGLVTVLCPCPAPSGHRFLPPPHGWPPLFAPYLQQQLSEPVQLGLQLLVVVLQDLHARLQAALVLPEDSCFRQELVVAGVLHQLGGARSQGRGLHGLVVLPFQTPQLSLEDPAGQPRSAPPSPFWRPARWLTRRQSSAGGFAAGEARGAASDRPCAAGRPACSSSSFGWRTKGTQLLPNRLRIGAGREKPCAVLSSAPGCTFTIRQELREETVSRALGSPEPVQEGFLGNMFWG